MAVKMARIGEERGQGVSLSHSNPGWAFWAVAALGAYLLLRRRKAA